MAKRKDLSKVHVAAIYFASQSQDITKIAEKINVSERTIRRWAKEDEWKHILELWGYDENLTFEKKPKRDPKRDSQDLFDKAYEAYKRAIKQGQPYHALARIVSEKVGHGLTRKRVRIWAKKYDWRNET